ncbi:MAG: response regulator [Oscillospiraceae bacterium]|nr:response regulator [Oscillospiraceae bacterium]
MDKKFWEKFSFLDMEAGLSYCCDSEDFYINILRSYCSNDKRPKLSESYTNKDWEDYRITVHSLKSTSRVIGASKVSESAEKLEKAAKEGNIDYIKENNAGLINSYGELMERIKSALADLDGAETEKKSPGVDEKPDNDDDAAMVAGFGKSRIVTRDDDLSGYSIRPEKPSIVRSGRRHHILVVDDDEINLEAASTMLADDFTVSCVQSGKKAFEFFAGNIPDLILLDVHMPDMNGFDFMNLMKRDKRLANISVVMLTADDDTDVEVRGFRTGAKDFIKKPFIREILKARIMRVIEFDELTNYMSREVERQTKKAVESVKKFEHMSLQMIQTLAGTIDAKDKYTNGHSIRVAEYAREIARLAGKNEDEQEIIYYMGLLHDIGKIGVPDHIINKDSRLTDEEYDIIKTHPVIGSEILKNVTEMPEIIVGARWHHERYDGTGYPDRLKGDNIPEKARIIGVADAYDAMTSKRSYRGILPQEVVRNEIVKGKGIQFDPEFADHMIFLMDNDKDYDMREK